MEQPRPKIPEDMVAQRAACERQISAVRDRLSSASAAYRAGALFSRSGGHQNLSRRGDLDGLKKRLKDLEADLAQGLSFKLAAESKCQRISVTISASASTSEQLKNLVIDQRNRRDQHATVISNVLKAVEALEAKNEEDDPWRKDIESSVLWYQKYLGFQAVVEGEGVKFVFDKVDLQSPEKEFSFSFKSDKDRYTLLRCSPPVEDAEELMKDLNLTNDLVKFVRIIRQRFQAAALNGDLAVSPNVCSDASAIPVSSPVINSVDSRRKNGRDKSNSQSKNKKPTLPSKRRASALSAASPGSVRRSPRIVGNG